MQNQNELLDDLLVSDPLQAKRRAKVKGKSSISLFLIHFLLLGSGLFYIDKELRRRWIYLLAALYAWLGYINVFVKAIPELSTFHNTTFVGGITIFAGWGIAYIIGSLDIFLTLARYRK